MTAPVDLEMFIGDTKHFDITVTQSGAPIDITGWIFQFVAIASLVRKSAPNALKVENMAFTITDAPNGKAKLIIAPALTIALNLERDAIYSFALRGTESGGATHTLSIGHIMFILTADGVAA